MSIFKPKKPIGIWLMSFIILLSLIATSTLAWFTITTQVSIQSPSDENLAVQVNSGDLEISVSYQLSDIAHYGQFTDYSDYLREIQLNISSPQYIDITGNGKSLWFPSYINDNDLPEFTDAASWSNVAGNVAYCVNLRLKFRTSQTMDVYLDNSSFVSGMEEILGTSFVRSSSMGNFSCDGIAGAVRVAFLETDSTSSSATENLKAVWIPNDSYQLSYTESGSSAIFKTSGTRETSYVYWTKEAGDMQMTTYTANTGDANYCNGQVIVGSNNLAVCEQSTVHFGAPLLSFVANGQIQEKYLTVRIWFEGTDREADTALDGGKVKYKLSFTGINKRAVTAEEQAAVDGITYYNGALRWSGGEICSPVDGVTQILYSYNGIDWSPYGSGVHQLTNGAVYVRSVETTEKRASAAKRVSVTN